MVPAEVLSKFVPRNAVPATLEEVRNLEALLAVKLPESYVELVMAEDEGHLGPIVTSWEPCYHFDVLAVDVSRFRHVGAGVLDVWDPTRWPYGLIPIGMEGNGDLVMFDYRMDGVAPRVLRLTKESRGEEVRTRLLATDFDELLDRARRSRKRHYMAARASQATTEREYVTFRPRDVRSSTPAWKLDDAIEDPYDVDALDKLDDLHRILRVLEEDYPSSPRPLWIERRRRHLQKLIKHDKK